MGAVVYTAICHFIGKLALFFMVIPAVIIGGAYLIGIIFLSIKELMKSEK